MLRGEGGSVQQPSGVDKSQREGEAHQGLGHSS